MKVKLLILSIITIFIGSIFIINSKKYHDTSSDKTISVSKDQVPIKIEDIDYKIESKRNEKGQILMYIKAKNNSSTTINYLTVDVRDNKKLNTSIEYLQKIKPHGKTDNYDSIKNSKDDRTKIPIKGYDGNYISELGKVDVQSISYTYNDNGIDKIVRYNTHTNKYTVSNY